MRLAHKPQPPASYKWLGPYLWRALRSFLLLQYLLCEVAMGSIKRNEAGSEHLETSKTSQEQLVCNEPGNTSWWRHIKLYKDLTTLWTFLCLLRTFLFQR
ncbi:Titin [Manis pentadactyla]|nr:Titin [Manis pentadactyla]